MPLQNIHPDDFCRACRGTGREFEREYQDGRLVTITGTCYACRGTGSKLVIFDAVPQ